MHRDAIRLLQFAERRKRMGHTRLRVDGYLLSSSAGPRPLGCANVEKHSHEHVCRTLTMRRLTTDGEGDAIYVWRRDISTGLVSQQGLPSQSG